jgi:hypothetical protein
MTSGKFFGNVKVPLVSTSTSWLLKINGYLMSSRDSRRKIGEVELVWFVALRAAANL